jgi:hypothetical protein
VLITQPERTTFVAEEDRIVGFISMVHKDEGFRR